MVNEALWSTVRLESVADEITVGYVGPMTSEYRFTGIPFLRSKNIKPFVIDTSDIRYISDEFHYRIRKSTLKPGDVVIVRTGAPGITAVIPEWLEEANCSDLVIVRPKSSLNPYYLAYFMNAVAQHQVFAHTVGAVQQHFNVGSAKKLLLPLPSRGEQDEIVQLLRAFDCKIELNREMNQTLEAIAHGVFKSWFVDFDPVTAKAAGRAPAGMNADIAALFPSRFVESELGLIPGGWEAISLTNAFEINPTRSLSNGQVAPYLDMQSMPTDSAQALDWFERPFGSGMKFRNGDTLIARITPCLENGKTAYVDFLADGQIGWGSTEYIVLRSKPPFPLEYTYFLARSDDFRSHSISNMTGSSGRQRVPVNCFDTYAVVKASTEILERFGDMARGCLALMKANSDQSHTLAAIRDSLLPKLLSGEIRVGQAEKTVAEAV